MADKRITDLNALATPGDNDELAIENLSSGQTEKITRANLLSGAPLPANTVDTQAIAEGAVTNVQLVVGAPVQMVDVAYNAVATGSTQIPTDDTAPQSTEGDEYMTITITPKSSTNILVIEANAMLMNSTGTRNLTGALFRDSENSAFAVGVTRESDATIYPVVVRGRVVAGSTAATTFKFRAGVNSTGTNTLNGQLGGRLWGDTTKSYITVTEYKAA